MAKPMRGLGKGLEALFADNDTADVAVRTLPISDIEPNAEQPRTQFAQEALNDLCDSIREHGILQPLLVRPHPSGRYQIVAGERRWRAARMAGLTELPVVVRELTDAEAYQLALVENLIRADLNPVEEALGYQRLMEEFDLTQEQISRKVSRSRPAVANALRLLGLTTDIIELLRKGDLTTGHARALLPLPQQSASLLARQIVSQQLSVRQTESAVKQLLQQATPPLLSPPQSHSYYREMELALRDSLSRKVKISHKGEGKGEITLEFFTQEELSDIGRALDALAQIKNQNNEKVN